MRYGGVKRAVYYECQQRNPSIRITTTICPNQVKIQKITEDTKHVYSNVFDVFVGPCSERAVCHMFMISTLF